MDHIGRIQRAIDYIEDHLKDELSIEAIADVAYFSAWHFQRVFGAIVGDSVKEYVRKRRLASALIELTSTERRILDIAIDHQFESQESFTRAFKALYRTTPGECRKEGAKSILLHSKPRITIEYLDHLFGGLSMQPKFVNEAAKKIVGFGSNFISPTTEDKSGYTVVRQLWTNFALRSTEVKNRKGHGIGLVESLPDSKKSQVEEYWYLAGSEVEDFTSVPDGMVTRTAPAGRYAVFTHRGQPAKLEHTLRYIYGSWLPKSGEELREAPTLTCRTANYDPNSDDTTTDIYIPVK
jgi:AraC family transcriptional regulator